MGRGLVLSYKNYPFLFKQEEMFLRVPAASSKRKHAFLIKAIYTDVTIYADSTI